MFLAAIMGVLPAHAQDSVPEQQTPVVVELFSSQACSFCPEADKMMEDIAAMDNVIALSCHVDYFDVKIGALSKPFCTDRQTEYVGLFGGGTHYTPQMVVNGHMDVVGYKAEKISAALIKGRSDRMAGISIQPKAEGVYEAQLPAIEITDREIKLWLATIDKPHKLTVASGANKGKKMVYTNIVDTLSEQGAWDGTEKHFAVSPQLTDGQAGFAIIAQDMTSGNIIAAGQFMTGL